VPILAILKDDLEATVQRTGRSGEELVFGRASHDVFVSSTVDNRAKAAWSAFNARAGEEAIDGNDPNLLIPITLHECRHTFASLLIDAGANPKAIQTFMATRRFRRPSTSTAICSQVITTTYAHGWMPISGNWRPKGRRLRCPLDGSNGLLMGTFRWLLSTT
jgi:hypothetical protein